MSAEVAVEPFTELDALVAREALMNRAPVFAARVAPLYRLLGWKWARENGFSGGDYIPNEAQILGALRELISGAIVQEVGLYSSTGGLSIRAEKNRDGSISASFSFELEDWDVETP